MSLQTLAYAVDDCLRTHFGLIPRISYAPSDVVAFIRDAEVMDLIRGLADAFRRVPAFGDGSAVKESLRMFAFYLVAYMIEFFNVAPEMDVRQVELDSARFIENRLARKDFFASLKRLR